MNRAGARKLLDEPALQRALTLLNAEGEEARVVGGAVRNALMGYDVHDFDIATTATPDVVIARAKAAGLRTIPTGLAHGTVTLLIDHRTFEVTTLREDIDTDGRHATIRFGRDFASDAFRRDFTINSLSMSIDGTIHDYTAGLDDMAAGRVRFIGDAETRIREDFLRILRFFRFSADYAGGDLDAAGLLASIRQSDGLARLSHERVRQELLKLLVARRAVPLVTSMTEAGILGKLLQSVPQPARLGRVVAIAPDSDPMLRLAATAVIIDDDAPRLRGALRLANAETEILQQAGKALTALHGAVEPPRLDELRALLFSIGRRGAVNGLILAWAESGTDPNDPHWARARSALEEMPEPRLPFSGSDLAAKGIAAGKPMGEALKRLQADWIRAGFPDDPKRLAELLASVTEAAPR